ncbi:cleavage stimulation factor subunit 2 tau variant [Homo sapiens]|uniref:Cleavage stimulation factor subunit 2 tau variant n=1 Tax=Homo sapiens TaxID=9606 RepID=CSTFT_HUMAN|nr:cleavage stimulation factor subunit 2 tau variant [Homo sapiens]Q9H0L4.1 RecName: Full=Cleavage stimulation factor subunit 2 tau variant; AltName: Full=CF-1 64 kDa subunit tau variant; AltName: Full=Cleavage stimulation factor 64 kDa subunit tau variant; Short=CSTF 64 kDa subunit tau variant; AltName: Full=TauCstF-64 [Homo sapiens]AAN05429.1 tCstF-64 [Homo sapiens]EAW54142.1 cleavage stimulation factor, 3' pre-RNA, subunit 2, 64kDa, tau variant [Homo sapiens]KAI2555827.1 cleavage stimulation|eukprot:NP_056050.1 cleavage stimulation factor subunit 2 tau variant [Homo sapiens]
MSSLAVRDPAMDRSLRSVFVGNIPYEATEEQLKDIFSEVGSVVSFRLVYDRETGKPKGYGFCEYQDQETALSAMRNLNGREFSGRALRVDNAASEKNKEELKSLGPAAPIIDSPYGDPIDPEDAPESITRAVASLPPEQMFELMKQMKLCVQNSHQEARNMLLQNPQLAYALLQAQVVMRIMDPEIALKILHRKIHVTPLIPGKSQSVSVSGPGPGPGPGLCPGPNVLLNQQNPPAPQPQHLARRPVKDIPPLMQTPIQGGIPAPGPIPAAVPGAGPGSLTPGGAMQPQLGMPGVGPVPLERGQVQMSDPRAPIPRGPVTPGGLPPRGLLGDAPNDPRGGTLLSVTGEVEPRGYLGPPHQGPPMHHASGHDTRGPSSHEMRGGPLGDPRLLIGEPRGPMIDQRGLPMDGRGGRDSRAMETRAMETEVLETRVMERRGMETCAMETRGMEARGMDARGLEMRGPVPSSRGPMTGGIQGPGPINIGAGGPPQGPRQVPGISGVGNPGAGMQGTGIQGTGMQGAGIQGGGMQGAGIQGVSIQGGGIQGGGIQGASKQGGSQPSSFSPGQSQVTPQDQEKAALIMQVLQLTADQIAMLPPEQRQSILILKEQIQKSTGAS